jgi:hypothetical protein
MTLEMAYKQHKQAITDMLEAAKAFHGGDMHRAADRAKVAVRALCHAAVEDVRGAINEQDGDLLWYGGPTPLAEALEAQDARIDALGQPEKAD